MKKNENKVKKTKKVAKPTAIILLDKLIFSCTSIVEDNFNHEVMRNPDYWNTGTPIPFGKTMLERTIDPSNRYRHSYAVYYNEWLMGKIDFGLYNYGIDPKGLLRFSVYNEVFSKDRLKYIPAILDDLNLSINNFKQIDIAIGSCKINSEEVIRRCIKNLNYTLKLFGRKVYDNNKTLKEITYYHSGSRINQFKLRSIYLKKGTKKRKPKNGEKVKRSKKNEIAELICYDKSEEIKEISGKEYISNFFLEQNSKFKRIYWSELRFQYEEIRRYSEKIKRVITFDDLLDPQFLSDMFFEYLDRMITVYEGTGRKKRDTPKIQLVDRPEIVQPQRILQYTLPIHNSTPSIHKNGYFNFNKFINEYSNKLYNNQLFISSIRNDMNSYINNNKSKYIRI